MSEATPAASSSDGDPMKPVTRRLRLEHREESLVRAYANAFRTYTSPEEVVIDFGFNLLTMNAASVADTTSDYDGAVTLDWTHRSVLSYRTAKSLAMDLARVIREYERVNGMIPVQTSPRPEPVVTPTEPTSDAEEPAQGDPR